MSYAYASGVLIDRSYAGLVFGNDGKTIGQVWLDPGALKLRQISHSWFHELFAELTSRPTNWDGRGSLAADSQSIFEAGALLESAMKSTSDLPLNWVAPHLSLDEQGHVVMEWWNGRNKLTIYVAPGEPEYVCSWGENIEEHMHSGELKSGGFPKLWRWLWI